MEKKRVFGKMPDGSEVTLYTISNGYITLQVTDLGATLVSCRIGDRDVALGYESAEEYLENAGNMGATVGRYANRISHGRFTLNGIAYQLPCNRPPHCLHGGEVGFKQKLWRMTEQSDSAITFCLMSPDGDQGFPGNIMVKATYALQGMTLCLTYSAESDADTICSLANHTYWNLAGHQTGHETLCGHVLMVPSEKRCQVDEYTVPTGELCPVAGSVFDLRGGVRLGDILGDENLKTTHGLDHPYALQGEWGKAASAKWNDLSMEVWTDAPCMQIYSGNGLPAVPGKDGAQYGPQVSFCLETQQFPDAPNHPEFPSAVLHAGEKKTYRTEYRFVKE